MINCVPFLLFEIFEALNTYWERRVGVGISAIRCLFTVCLQEGLDIVAYARPAVTCHYFAESLDGTGQCQRIIITVSHLRLTSVSFLTAFTKAGVNLEVENVWNVPRALVMRLEGNP